ncbi:hypothetical protein ACJMK2_037705, partial [Sinanodonta woodiana]
MGVPVYNCTHCDDGFYETTPLVDFNTYQAHDRKSTTTNITKSTAITTVKSTPTSTIESTPIKIARENRATLLRPNTPSTQTATQKIDLIP